MKVRVRYYALLREVIGVDSEDIDLDSCTIEVRDLIEIVTNKHPELAEIVSSGRVFIVHSGNLIRELNQVLDLCSDRKVDLIPPSAGGDKLYEASLLHGQKVDVEGFLKELYSRLDPEVGAVAIYFGVVKGSINGKKVEELKYEFHEEYTEKVLAKIAEEASMTNDVHYVKVHHSVGTFKPGDTIFAVGVLSRGRKSAIKALQDIIERVKHEVAIWKIERREDGVFWVVGDGERLPAKASSSR
ncbi:MAG: molybdenum cofactor biosynthesis protein MoaE [Sulfolobales archaeon]|nr:molybdenum cofactor biosynthesis protein MoaE [Sulfolobales archaeon]MDW8083212.1 molybdenum cofactor biosynthesis protein MoaE [Sulfolobales archaeon]